LQNAAEERTPASRKASKRGAGDCGLALLAVDERKCQLASFDSRPDTVLVLVLKASAAKLAHLL
jgi:hypothetical protein